MTELTEEQYRRVAQWLDGEPVSLSDPERAAAEALRDDEAFLAGVAPAEAPATALHGAGRRLRAEMARPSHAVVWFRRLAAVAAAAIVVLSASLWQPRQTGGTAEPPVETVLVEMENATSAGEVDLLADELASFQADLLPTPASDVTDLEIEAIEQHVDDLRDDLLDGSLDDFFDDLLSDEPASWSLDEDTWSS